MKIGVMFGNPETTTGGNALKFYASVRLDIRRIGPIKDRDEVVGNSTRVKVVKNKVAPPFRSSNSTSCTAKASPKPVSWWILASRPVSLKSRAHGIPTGISQSWLGRENAKTFLKSNPGVAQEIEDKIRASHGLDFHMEDGGSSDTVLDD